MNARQEIKQLKGQIQFLEARNAFLDKKIEQQSQEILKAVLEILQQP